MTRYTLLGLVVALLLSIAATAQVLPQRLAQLQVVTRGTGFLRLDNQNYNINQVTIFLQGNGSVTLDVRGDYSTQLSGNWTGSLTQRVGLQITDGFDRRRTSGSGSVAFTNDRQDIRQLELSGVTGRQNFIISFAGSGGGGGGRGEVHTSARGRGQLTIGYNQTYRIREVQVDLYRNGTAQIQVSGQNSVTFGGNWSGNTRNRVDLQINSGFNANTIGRGVLLLDGRDSIEQLNISGSVGRQPFTVTFDARGGGGGEDNRRALEATERGTGSLTVGFAQVGSFELAMVSLRRNGEARITLGERNPATFTGTWNPTTTDGNIVQVTITGSDLPGATTGTAYIYLVGNNSFNRIDMFGTTGRIPFSARFASR